MKNFLTFISLIFLFSCDDINYQDVKLSNGINNKVLLDKYDWIYEDKSVQNIKYSNIGQLISFEINSSKIELGYNPNGELAWEQEFIDGKFSWKQGYKDGKTVVIMCGRN